MGPGARAEKSKNRRPPTTTMAHTTVVRIKASADCASRSPAGPKFRFFSEDYPLSVWLCFLDKMAFCVGVKRHQNEERLGELSFLCLCRLSIERLEEPLKNNDDAFHCHLAGRRNSKNTWHGYD